MAALTISNTEPRESYDVGGTPSTGPFGITWEFFDLTDIRVFVDGTELTYDASPGAGEFSVAGTAADGGGYSGGTVTLGEAVSNAEVVLLGAVPITRTTNFQTSGFFPIPTLNLQLNKLFVVLKQILVTAKRALSLPDDEAGPVTIPSAADRALKYLAFDADGNVIASPAPEGGNVVSAYAATLLDDADATAARATLGLGSAAVLNAGAGSGDLLRSDGSGANLTDLPVTAVIANARGLVAKYASASTVDIDADEMLLKSAAGDAFLAEAVNLTLNIAAAGANGLDTGSEANSTWYYGWVIYNPTTETVAGLISTSATNPTLPSGYTYKALATVFYNTSGGDIRRFWQSDRRVWTARETVFASQAASTSYASQSISGYVPPIAKTAAGVGGSNSSSTARWMAVAGDANAVGQQLGESVTGSNVLDGWYGAFPFEVPLMTAQTLYWKGTDTVAGYKLDICGFTI